MAWSPSIHAAAAPDATCVAVALFEQGWEDRLSVLLRWQAGRDPAWARTDLPGEVVGLQPAPPGLFPGVELLALACDGELFLLDGAGIAGRERVADRGDAFPDAFTGLHLAGGALWATASGEELYRRGPAGWTRVPLGLAPEARRKPLRLTHVAGGAPDDLYLLGVAAPVYAELPEEEHERLAALDDWDAWDAARAALRAADPMRGKADEGRLVHWDGSRWSRVDLPGTAVFHGGALVEPDGTAWLPGTGGLLLAGDARRGFAVASRGGTADDLLSAARWQGALVLAADGGLYRLAGGTLVPFDPAPAPSFAGRIVAHRLHAGDDALFYFDHRSGVHRLAAGRDGWQHLRASPRLLVRRPPGRGPSPAR